MKFHGYMLNALIRAGHNENAADAALEALQEYLRNREAELRAEGLHADAVWYARLRNEMCLACREPWLAKHRDAGQPRVG